MTRVDFLARPQVEFKNYLEYDIFAYLYSCKKCFLKVIEDRVILFLFFFNKELNIFHRKIPKSPALCFLKSRHIPLSLHQSYWESRYLYLVLHCSSKFSVLETHQDIVLFTSISPEPCTMPGKHLGNE